MNYDTDLALFETNVCCYHHHAYQHASQRTLPTIYGEAKATKEMLRPWKLLLGAQSNGE